MMLAYDSAGELYTNSSMTYNAGVDRQRQSGMITNGVSNSTKCVEGWALTNNLVGPFSAYYVFASDYYCHIVIEIVTNRFAHAHLGVIEKSGNFNGGDYYTGTFWQSTVVNTSQYYSNDPNSNYHSAPFDSAALYYYWPSSQYRSRIRVDADGASGNWVGFGGYLNNNGTGVTLNAAGFMRGPNILREMFLRSINSLNGLPVLLPSLVAAPRPIGGVSILGSVRDVRCVNISTSTPKQSMFIGTDEWMLFPLVRKGTGSIYESVSGDYGIAYRKVV
jgi:hypothetical protein